ncbi:hypothetical protein E3N88_13755 [Mikania micrantha]|uniref:Uncharacterized protein n=1 Tax=Mikania micrantha TaxID=192012 RepID=A0A5N6P2J2_9ASTR|nr:hypothetical protein E3N88_13755 [Mikania micrantha]
MESWKMALTQIADLKGRDVRDRKESDFIKEVVADIHRRLRVSLSNTLPRLIGMDHYIRFINLWLMDGSCHTVDILTVVGMSGIGKTSLARHVFGLHLSKFDKSSFLEGINAKAIEHSNGLLDLQKQLHGDISKKIELRVNDVIGYTSKIEYVLARKRVFIVLDDIGSMKQLDALLGNKGLHRGSNQNPKEGYEVVSEKLIKYCEGHPLAIQALGRSLQDEDVAQWEDCINLLKKEPHSHINTTLKMSFDALVFENDKELFKHIACFFVRTDRNVTQLILEACDINTRSGIRNLVDKCLLRIGWNNELIMHQLVQEMGRDLVRQESPEKSWKRSRSWCHLESFKVLKQKKAKGNILGLALDMKMIDKKRSIPFDLPMENVVVLDMSYSNIEYFDMLYSNPQPPTKRQKGLIGSSSNDKRLLGSLKILDMSFCEQLHSIDGFSELPTLESLILRNCVGIEVCESIEQCNDLVHIDLSHCYKLRKLPKSLAKLKKVQTLLLDGCNFRESQIEMWNVKAIPNNPSIRKIKFDLEMSPLNFYGVGLLLSLSSFEIDGMVKIQGMENVEEKLLHSLGWIDLEFTTEIVFKTFTFGGKAITCQTQKQGSIPSSLKKLQGLNFFCIIKKKPVAFAFVIPVIKISNITKSHTWIYKHYIAEVYYDFIEENIEDGNVCLCLLSHWMFGPNEMKEGDHIIVTVANEYSLELIFENGIGLVYGDGSMEEEEDVLGYYKSWNHIIGGDLSPFHTQQENTS